MMANNTFAPVDAKPPGLPGFFGLSGLCGGWPGVDGGGFLPGSDGVVSGVPGVDGFVGGVEGFVGGVDGGVVGAGLTTITFSYTKESPVALPKGSTTHCGEDT